MMGKRYIMLYSPGYYKPKLSFYYLIFQILGYAFGPFIAGALTFIPEGQIWKLKYNCFSCIGWYECVGSIILFILNNILFTRPDSQKVIPYNMHNSSLNSGFKEDLEDTLDKEFYNMKKEMINSNLDNQSDSVRNSIDNNENAVDKALAKTERYVQDGIISAEIYASKAVREETTEKYFNDLF